MGKQDRLNILILYGPNEGDTAEIKDRFWEDATEVVENSLGEIIVLGDLNGRVGSKDAGTGDTIGIHGEITRNNNGWRIIDFCMQNDLVVMNSFFQHRDVHKYTREVKSRNERSIIDYVVINRSSRHEIMDVRVRRGPEINSDHYLVVAKTKIGTDQKETRRETHCNNSREVLRTYRLSDKKIAQTYGNRVEAMLGEIGGIENFGLENMWEKFKSVLVKAAKEVCGTTKVNRSRKQTAWWNEDIKQEVKLKKEKWKQYLKDGTEQKYGEYKKQREKVKEVVLAAKKKSWEEFGLRMESDYHTNNKLFYKMIKNLRLTNKKQNMKLIRNKEGVILTNENDIMERWKEYFQNLLNSHRDDRDGESVEHVREQHGEENISTKDVEMNIERLKNGKAAGHDNITVEMLKNMGKKGKEILTRICNKVWSGGRIPGDWEVGVILPIHKKGDKRDCNNYRGITLLSNASKVYEGILENKLMETLESQLEQSQSGFRKGRSIQDHIFTIKQITEKVRNTNCEIFQAFLDLEKAFDRLPRAEIEKCLRKRGVDPQLRRAIMSLYQNTRSYIRTDNLQSGEFVINEGIRQGGVLSPTLFNVVMDEVIKETRGKTSRLFVGYHNMKPVWLSECAFADDVVVFAKSESQLKNNLDIWNKKLIEKGLKLNEEKTKIMVSGKTHRPVNIEVNGKKIEQVKSIKYLGVKLDGNGQQDIEIAARIESAANVYHAPKNGFISKREISVKAKMSVYKTVFVPILTYGCESWVLTKRHKTKIQSMEMKYLRRVLGVTRMDRIRNDVIRKQLKVQPVLKRIEDCQLRWYGHLRRMNEERPVKKIWEAKRQERRNRGRPMTTWDASLEKLMGDRGITRTQAAIMARSKREWRKFIYGEDRN